MSNGELEHSSHPQHKLKLVDEKEPYTCNGCHEIGFGIQYKCGACNFHLHKYCASPELAITHAFFPRCTLKFLEEPRICHIHPHSPCIRPYCDICMRPIKGYNYHCPEKGHDLHPSCAMLPEKILLYGGDLTLKLKQKTSSECYHCRLKEASISMCGAKMTSWSYVSTCKGKHVLHVACLKNMLLEHWKKECPGHVDASDAKPLVKRAPEPGTVPQEGEGSGSITGEAVFLAIHVGLELALHLAFHLAFG